MCVLQIHFPFPFFKQTTLADGLQEALDLGLASAVGVCNYNTSQLEQIHGLLDKKGIALATNQVSTIAVNLLLLLLLLHCLIALVVGNDALVVSNNALVVDDNAAVSLAPHAFAVIQHAQIMLQQSARSCTLAAPCALVHLVTSCLFGYIGLFIITSCQL